MKPDYDVLNNNKFVMKHPSSAKILENNHKNIKQKNPCVASISTDSIDMN